MCMACMEARRHAMPKNDLWMGRMEPMAPSIPSSGQMNSIRKRIDRTGYTFLALDTGNTIQADGHRDCK